MALANFPASLIPIIQQGFLEREFNQALRTRKAFRQIADRESIPVGDGESITKTRAGLKPTATTPIPPASNSGFDNGITPSGWAVEQYTLTMAMYAATQDLNMVTTRVGIASQFLQNAYVNGEQAGRTLEDLARNALFNSYMGGNTRVRVTLGGNGVAVSVDDIRGFQYAPYLANFTNAAAAAAAGAPGPTMAAVSTANTLAVTVGSNVYTLVGAAADTTNVSTAPGGISGVLTFSTNVTVADGTAGNTVTSAIASAMIRPSARANSSLLQASDTLTMANLLDAVTKLRLNAVPEVGGAYNCYLDPVSARQLFADPDFKQLFQGATSSSAPFRAGMVNDFLGLRFFPTTEALVQAHPSISGLAIRRPIICGQGALIEGDFAGMGHTDFAPADSLIDIVDGVAMVTREALDRLQQIIAQSWYWIGGFCAPTDVTTNATTIGTATNSAYKRAVIIEHVG